MQALSTTAGTVSSGDQQAQSFVGQISKTNLNKQFESIEMRPNKKTNNNFVVNTLTTAN